MLWATQVLLSDDLGQNKIEQQTPILPKSRMKPREGQKRAIFPSLIWGGEGGLGFLFILSKIVREISDLAQFSVKCFSVEVITVNDKNTGFLSDI